jgi:hypothetical protein
MNRLKFRLEGDYIKAVYSDAIPKLNLGAMEVTRVSSVDFNHTTQNWEAKVGNSTIISKYRDRVLEDEKLLVEKQLGL